MSVYAYRATLPAVGSVANSEYGQNVVLGSAAKSLPEFVSVTSSSRGAAGTCFVP